MDHGAVLGGESLDRLSAMFQSRGLGARAGLGAHPALLIIDMQYGFTDPESSLGAAVDETIAAAGKLAEAARSRSIPVIYTTCVWSEAAAVWARKLPAQRDLVHGSRWVQIDGRIAPQKGDLVLEKNFASAFFGTDLHTRLQTLHIDTLVLTGVTTSGCIRASAVDGCSYGYRVGIAREAVGDRADEPHVMSLFDLDAKYADVMTCDEVNAYLSAPVH
jgi:nicotinamidase-related amidase